MESWLVYLPVVEHRQSEGLSLCVCSQVRLKSEGVDGWDESLNGVEGRPWNGCILGDMTPVRGEDHIFKNSNCCTMTTSTASLLCQQQGLTNTGCLGSTPM